MMSEMTEILPSNLWASGSLRPAVEFGLAPQPGTVRLVGVREYGDGLPVEVYRNTSGRLVLQAYNEAGYCSTLVDLEDLLEAVSRQQEHLAALSRKGKTDE